MANLTHLEAQADAWRTFASRRARFNVERKAEQALAFAQQRGARTFAIPTKLEGVGQFQTNLRDVRNMPGLALAELEVKADPAEDGALIVCWGGLILGLIQQKHVGWLRPLLATHRLRFFLLQITGGTEHKPTLGCNVVIAGIPDALEAQARGYGFRPSRQRAVTAAA